MTFFTYSNPQSSLAKKPLDPNLFSGPRGTVDDVRVQSGYPIWNLIATWMVADYNDAVVIDGYTLPLEEWEAAKQYYLDHKLFIDARIIGNTQPAADDDVPIMHTSDEYFAWLARQDEESAGTPAQTPQHG